MEQTIASTRQDRHLGLDRASPEITGPTSATQFSSTGTKFCPDEAAVQRDPVICSPSDRAERARLRLRKAEPHSTHGRGETSIWEICFTTVLSRQLRPARSTRRNVACPYVRRQLPVKMSAGGHLHSIILALRRCTPTLDAQQSRIASDLSRASLPGLALKAC